MKIAVVYNRDSNNVINLFGFPNKEKYGKENIKRITDALKTGGHKVIAIEGDKNLIPKLEEFMPQVLRGERPGIVFNLSYGVQGHARYAHVPGILEMIGIPYIGSGPLAHSLALDKVVAKMIFQQNGIPTPEFAVMHNADDPLPAMPFPLIVKPRSGAVSIGVRIVNDEHELRDAAAFILDNFENSVIIEQYIDGREINVGVIGNNPPETFPPAELIFTDGSPPIYTLEDKKKESGRDVKVACPADISPFLSEKARQIAVKAFKSIGCYDCCRVDMRIDSEENIYLLEINSLPSLGSGGSFVLAANAVGIDFTALINRLVDVACARYFGTSAPPHAHSSRTSTSDLIFRYFTKERDRMEKSLRDWVRQSTRANDPAGIQLTVEKLNSQLNEIGLKSHNILTNRDFAWSWETAKGFEGGTLFIGHLDIPFKSKMAQQSFRRGPDLLYGNGIGSSRGPLVMLLSILRALRSQRLLQKFPIGVLYYFDEDQECRYSTEIITEAASKAKRVFILRPGNPENKIITQRRGQRKYLLSVEGTPQRLGKQLKEHDPLNWLCSKAGEIARLSSKKERIAITIVDIKSEAYPLLLPHSVVATLLMSFPDSKRADELESQVREILDRDGPGFNLTLIADRPPMKKRQINTMLATELIRVGYDWGIDIETDSSLWPSAAGLVPAKIPVVCGVGPVARDLFTPNESLVRISLVQRALLLTQFLLKVRD